MYKLTIYSVRVTGTSHVRYFFTHDAAWQEWMRCYNLARTQGHPMRRGRVIMQHNKRITMVYEGKTKYKLR